MFRTLFSDQHVVGGDKDDIVSGGDEDGRRDYWITNPSPADSIEIQSTLPQPDYSSTSAVGSCLRWCRALLLCVSLALLICSCIKFARAESRRVFVSVFPPVDSRYLRYLSPSVDVREGRALLCNMYVSRVSSCKLASRPKSSNKSETCCKRCAQSAQSRPWLNPLCHLLHPPGEGPKTETTSHLPLVNTREN